jgi:hypothetical protein
MTYAFVQSVQNSVAASSATTLATGNFTANPTAGNLIFAAVSYGGNGTPSLTGLTITLSDTRGNTYTLLKNVDDTTNGYRLAIFYAKNITGGGANSVTATFSSAPSGSFYKGVFAAEYSGLDTTAPFTSGECVGQQQLSVATGTDHLTSGNTPTLATQPCAVIGFCTIDHNTNGPPAAGTGFTSRGTFWDFGVGGVFACLEDRRVTATTAVAATFTPNVAAADWSTVVAVFREPAPPPPSMDALSRRHQTFVNDDLVLI